MPDRSHHSLPQKLRRYRIDERLYTLIIAAIIGLLSGYGAVLFRFVIKMAQYVFYRSTEDILNFAHTLPPFAIVVIPALGGLLVGLIVHFGAREAKGHGVPEVMEAVALRDGRMRKRVAGVKILASAICIGSGGSVGREGPIVQIGSSLASTVSQVLDIARVHQRTMVGCGAAAGIAATFNAPIAGVLFALEVLLGDFGLASFSPVVLSSVTATTISRHYFGDFPAFIIPGYTLNSLWEFGIYPFLGVMAGLVALLFIITLYKAEDLFELLPIPEWLKPALGGLILGLVLSKWPHVFGVGYGAINKALLNNLPGLFLCLLIFLKIAATSITLGSGGSGGIFAPSLFIGAMTGGFFGWIANSLFPGIPASPGAYALVGMGAVVAGTTHAPITAILIIFEMSGNYKIILPMMITCILSTIITVSFKKGSIYTIKLLRRGVDIAGGMEQNILRTLKVGQFMTRDVPVVGESMKLIDLINTFKRMDVSYLHVVDGNGDLSGIISFRDVRPLLQEEALHHLVVARDVATTDLVTVTPDENILTAFQMMSDSGISQLPVVSEENGKKLVGTLRDKDIMAAYDKAVIRHEIEGL
ncbi:MAG: chloride channel protein [Deltaproteobacteria bacterium]|nr:chloride channel protein [Deltaproteobacteria bacterium]MBW1927759.1 chloride channel protein [Deltaproteobacteria bacterium]RLB24491.1 MAG: chloride channel protein [Deltaproteobacteria bacterium]